MYAVIRTGGKQYRVNEGDMLRIEKIPGDVGADVSFDEVLLVVKRERVLDVLISKLRRKVWDCAQMELPLRSARNAGYVFAGRVGRVADPSVPATAATQH